MVSLSYRLRHHSLWNSPSGGSCTLTGAPQTLFQAHSIGGRSYPAPPSLSLSLSPQPPPHVITKQAWGLGFKPSGCTHATYQSCTCTSTSLTLLLYTPRKSRPLIDEKHASNAGRGQGRKHTGKQGRKGNARDITSTAGGELRQHTNLGSEGADVAEALC